MRALALVRGRIDWRDDRGFAGGAEALPFGVLIFVVGTLMVFNLWSVIDTKMAVNAAAREGARYLAESDGGGEGDVTQARIEAQAALDAHRKDLSVFNLVPAYPESGTWKPCTPIVVTVSAQVSLVNLPLVNGTFGTRTVISRHSEIVDPYRSRDAAFDGEVQCR